MPGADASLEYTPLTMLKTEPLTDTESQRPPVLAGKPIDGPVDEEITGLVDCTGKFGVTTFKKYNNY